MRRRLSVLVTLCALLVAVSATTLGGCFGSCFGGRSDDARGPEHLQPYGLQITPLRGMSKSQSQAGYVFVSGDSSSNLRITPAPPGPAAMQRQPATLLQGLGVAAAQVHWSGPCVVGGGLACLEAGLVDPARGQAHWVAIVDGPAGAVLFDHSTSQQYRPVPNRDAPAWRSLVSSIRPAE